MVQIIFSYAFIIIAALLFAMPPTIADATMALAGNVSAILA